MTNFLSAVAVASLDVKTKVSSYLARNQAVNSFYPATDANM